MKNKDLKELKKKLLPYLIEAKWIGLDNHCLSKEFHDTVYLFQDDKVLLQLIDQVIQSTIEKERKSHKTKNGYCCACGYDIAVMEEKIQSAIKEREKEIMEIVSKELYTNGAIRIDGLNRISDRIKRKIKTSFDENGEEFCIECGADLYSCECDLSKKEE